MPLPLWKAFALLAAVTSACTGAAEPDTMSPVLDGLCRARAALPGDLAEAEDAFDGSAHEPLHGLASDLEAADERRAAAALLEAKQAVEAAFRDGALPEIIADRLDRLIVATRDGLVAAGEPSPAACDE